MVNLKQFFEKKDICVDDLMYITKRSGTGIVEFHLFDGRTQTRYMALRDVLSELPDCFVPINKGIIVNIKYIKCINRYVYHMQDGTTFYGKLKAMESHERLKEMIQA